MTNTTGENRLITAFDNSLKQEVAESLSEYVEIGLDMVLENEILKEIPLLSTVVSVFKIGNTVKERFHIKKLVLFLDTINRGIPDEEYGFYREKIQDNRTFREKEVEYIILLLDHLFEENKARNVGKLYLSYLDGLIKWEEFQSITSLLDKIIPQDIEKLWSLRNLDKAPFTEKSTNSSIQRLIGAGIVANVSFGLSLGEDGHLFYSQEEIKNEQIGCRLTDIGKLMVESMFR